MTKGKITYLKTGTDCWFEGTFKDGSWHEGVYRNGNATYEGTFVNQTINGVYFVQWTTGITYEGSIQANKLHGEGVMTFPQGKIAKIKGTWAEDELVSCELLTMQDGSTATNFVP